MVEDEDRKFQILSDLRELSKILAEGGERQGALLIKKTLGLTYGTPEFWQEVTNTSIWGGSGSLFDQALIGSPRLRAECDRLLLRLSELLEDSGKATSFVKSANFVLAQLVLRPEADQF